MNYKIQLDERADNFKKHSKPFTYAMPPPSDGDKPFLLMDCKLAENPKTVSCFKSPSNSNRCYKCVFLRRVWMIAVNLYDFMGLLDICPCGTLHPISPYIT